MLCNDPRVAIWVHSFSVVHTYVVWTNILDYRLDCSIAHRFYGRNNVCRAGGVG